MAKYRILHGWDGFKTFYFVQRKYLGFIWIGEGLMFESRKSAQEYIDELILYN